MAISAESEMPVLPMGPVGNSQTLLGWSWTDASGRAAAWLEYVGRTALVLTGPYTGQRYCFTRPGARLAVDSRDRQALLAVPVLRQVLC